MPQANERTSSPRSRVNYVTTKIPCILNEALQTMSHSNSESSEWATYPDFRPLLSSSSLALAETIINEEDDISPRESPSMETAWAL